MESIDDEGDDCPYFLLLFLILKSFSRNTADIIPATDEPAMMATSMYII
jgi:hypothetical protein